MTATILDMLKKYPTEFNIDEIPDTIKNITVGENLDTLTKPTHKKINNHNQYTYKLTIEEGIEQTIIIDNYLGHYTVNFPYDPTGKEPGGFFIDESGMDYSYS